MQKVKNICSASQAFIVTNFSESKASKILVGKSAFQGLGYICTHIHTSCAMLQYDVGCELGISANADPH